MANVNLLSQLAKSVAPRGEPFSPVQAVATGQQLQAGDIKLQQLRQQLDLDGQEAVARQRAQEILQRVAMGGAGYEEAGRELLAVDPRSGIQLMELGQADAERQAELDREAAMADQFGNLLGASQLPIEQQALARQMFQYDPKAALNLLMPDEAAEVNWTFKEGAGGNILAIHPRTLEVRDTGIMAQDNSFGGAVTLPDGTEVFFGKGGYSAKQGNIPVDPKIGRDIQDQDLKDNKMLADLFRLGQDFMGGAFGGQTYQGKLLNWGLEKMDKAGIGNPASDWGEKRLQQATRFKQGIEQIFNQYRKEITGAAASVQELERLKEAMMNADLSPTQFESSYNEFIAKIMRGQKIAAQMAREGYDPSKDENAEMFDRMWNAGVFGDAERINYLNLMQNINAGKTNQDDQGNTYASDGEKWIRIRSAQ